jgi:nucleoside-diphosphate-sugar epimerase
MAEENLGLDAETFASLASRVNEVFHCAASTRFDLPYAEARAINVTGLERIHALAAAAGPGFRRLNHVSTAYVVGDREGVTHATDLPGPDAPYRNTYEQTKAEAERFLHEQARVPFAVFRPSIVTGDSQDGVTGNWNVVYYPMRLISDGKVPYLPSIGPALVDCVPVDFVADAMLALARRDDIDGQTFNLTAGDEALTVRDVIEHTYAGVARRQGKPAPVRTTALGRLGWWFMNRWARLRYPSARRFLDRFAVYEPYCAVACHLSNERELALLAEEGVSFPSSHEAFAVVVDYALEQNFGRDPEPEQRATGIGAALAQAVESFASGEISGFGAVA